MNKIQELEKYDGKWLEAFFIENPKLKKIDLGTYLAHIFSWKPSSGPGIVTRMISGDRTIKASEASAIMSFFSKPPMNQEQKDQKTIIVPDYHAPMTSAQTPNIWEIPSDLIPLESQNKNLALVLVRGDSMTPDIKEGDRVIIDIDDKTPSPAGIFALDDGAGGTVIKRLEILFQQDQKSIRIISSNPHYSPYEVKADQITIIGRVILRIGRV